MLVLSGSYSWPVTARNATAIGERDFRVVRERLVALSDESLLETPFDARRSALAALLAVRVAQREEVQAFLRRLHRNADFTMERVAELESLARAMLYILEQEKYAASLRERGVWDDYLRRAWTLIVPVYGEVRMAEALAGARETTKKPRKATTDHPTVRPPIAHARRHPRVEVELEVVVLSEPSFSPGFVENLSEGGLFVGTDDPMPIGSHVTMMVGLPDGEAPIALTGQVRWQRRGTTMSEAPPGMGIQFGDVAGEDAARIRHFIAGRVAD